MSLPAPARFPPVANSLVRVSLRNLGLERTRVRSYAGTARTQVRHPVRARRSGTPARGRGKRFGAGVPPPISTPEGGEMSVAFASRAGAAQAAVQPALPLPPPP